MSNLHGVLLLDKPLGLSSYRALRRAQTLFNVRKAGHGGSLDPLATGLLAIYFGEALKFCRFSLDSDKYYEVEALLGVQTSTGDAEGAVLVRSPVPLLSISALQTVLATFKGPLDQIPPMHSAIKQEGQPLYKLARAGIVVPRQARTIHIHALELLYFEGDALRLGVRCSKGTYIRTLVEDIGKALGCGAHVRSLRRLASGSYQASGMHTLESLEQVHQVGGLAALASTLIPLNDLLSDWPAVHLDAEQARRLIQGQVISLGTAVLAPSTIPLTAACPYPGELAEVSCHEPWMPRTSRGTTDVLYTNQGNSQWLRLNHADGQLLGIGQISEAGQVVPKRLLSMLH